MSQSHGNPKKWLPQEGFFHEKKLPTDPTFGPSKTPESGQRLQGRLPRPLQQEGSPKIHHAQCSLQHPMICFSL
jgi:hypothetical protein